MELAESNELYRETLTSLYTGVNVCYSNSDPQVEAQDKVLEGCSKPN